VKRGLVAKPTNSDMLLADIARRLADFHDPRSVTMDAAGIDLRPLATRRLSSPPRAASASTIGHDAADRSGHRPSTFASERIVPSGACKRMWFWSPRSA